MIDFCKSGTTTQIKFVSKIIKKPTSKAPWQHHETINNKLGEVKHFKIRPKDVDLWKTDFSKPFLLNVVRFMCAKNYLFGSLLQLLKSH